MPSKQVCDRYSRSTCFDESAIGRQDTKWCPVSLGNSSAPLRMCRLTPEFLMNYTLCPCWSRHKNLSSSSVCNLKPRAIWILAGRILAKLSLNPLRYLRREMQFQRQVKLCCQLEHTSQKLKTAFLIFSKFIIPEQRSILLRISCIF